jgi:prophage antirepressor-like protein
MNIISQDFNGIPLRIGIDDSQKLWFLANDVCMSLGYSNPRDAIRQHCNNGGVAKHDIPSPSGVQSYTLIDEPNLYRLIMKSKKKEAVDFQDWVTEKVLPSIRKTGGYSVSKKEPQLTPAQMFLQQAQAMVDMESKIDLIEEKVKLLEAKNTTSPVDYYAVAGYASYLHIPVDVKMAAELGRKASALCNQLGYVTGQIPDPRFGRVKTYPIEVLKAVFEDKKICNKI